MRVSRKAVVSVDSQVRASSVSVVGRLHSLLHHPHASLANLIGFLLVFPSWEVGSVSAGTCRYLKTYP